jgi:hypothetical protein
MKWREHIARMEMDISENNNQPYTDGKIFPRNIQRETSPLEAATG